MYVSNWLRGEQGGKARTFPPSHAHSHAVKGWKDDGWWRRMWPNAFRNYWIIKQRTRTTGPGYFLLLFSPKSLWMLPTPHCVPLFIWLSHICLCTELLTWPKLPTGKAMMMEKWDWRKGRRKRGSTGSALHAKLKSCAPELLFLLFFIQQETFLYFFSLGFSVTLTWIFFVTTYSEHGALFVLVRRLNFK